MGNIRASRVQPSLSNTVAAAMNASRPIKETRNQRADSLQHIALVSDDTPSRMRAAIHSVRSVMNGLKVNRALPETCAVKHDVVPRRIIVKR